MVKKSWLSDHAEENGKENLVHFAMGIIKAITVDNALTTELKIKDIEETIVYLNEVRWELEKADALTPAQEKFIQLDFTTLDAVMEEVPVTWTIDDLPLWTAENVLRQEG